jgi:hypothetical protein
VPEAACHDHVDKIRRAPASSICFLLNRQEIGSTQPEYAAKNILAPQIERELQEKTTIAFKAPLLIEYFQ